MATSSGTGGAGSRMYTADEVLALLEDQEEFETQLGELTSFAIDLDGESEDDDEIQGDGTRSDGSQLLLNAEFLTPDGAALIAHSLNSPLPSERDSILLADSELNEGS